MGSICVLAPCPSLSHSKDRQGILQLVSFTLKRSHFRALFSIFQAGFQRLLLKMPPCPLLFICFTPAACWSSLHKWGVGAQNLGRLCCSALAWLLVLGCSLLVISCALGLG